MARRKATGWQRHIEQLQADPDMTRALKCIRAGFGEITILAVTPHETPEALARLVQVLSDPRLFEED